MAGLADETEAGAERERERGRGSGGHRTLSWIMVAAYEGGFLLMRRSCCGDGKNLVWSSSARDFATR